jgi:hypothetical protein
MARRSTKRGSTKKKATKKRARRTTKKATKKKTAKKATKKKTAKKATKKTAKKRPAKKAAATTSAGKRKAAKKSSAKKKTTKKKARADESRSKVAEKSPAAGALAKKRAAGNRKTVPGGTAPKTDDVTRAKKALREVREIVERVNDADAEQILGDGNLEKLLTSVVPAPTRNTKSTHEHLAKHKRRASLLARLRHDINDRSAFAVDGHYVSPTRVQWFYDGLTFLEGQEPYRGVVGLYRDGVIGYGLGVDDVGKEDSLGPLASDFVSLDDAKKSFRGATGKPSDALAEMMELATEGGPDTTAWVDLLARHPWVLGAQHASVARVDKQDPDLPKVVGKRARDGATDIILVEPQSTPIVGKTGKVLASFRGVWGRAEQLRSFVQRQASYLSRELRLKIREPRFLIIAGGALTDDERAAVRREMEAHHAAVRLLTYDELRRLAERTLAFFESRL